MAIQFLPLAAKGLLGLGKATLALGGTSAVAGAIPGFKKTFGQDDRSQGRNRTFTRDAEEGYKLESSLPEKFFDFTMGRDRTKMREAAQAKSDAFINRAITNDGSDVGALNQVMTDMGLDSKLIPKLDSDQTLQSFRNEIDRAKSVIKTAKDAQQLQPGIDLKGLNEAGINREYSRLKQEKADRKESKQDGILAMQNALANRGYDIQDARDARQSAYDNRVLDITTAREARDARDKQLMLLVQGLNAFGQGIA